MDSIVLPPTDSQRSHVQPAAATERSSSVSVGRVVCGFCYPPEHKGAGGGGAPGGLGGGEERSWNPPRRGIEG